MEFFQCSEIQQEEHFMRNENKDWKPEVGKTAWLFGNKRITLVSIVKKKRSSAWKKGSDPAMVSQYTYHCQGGGVNDWFGKFGLFPTPEAALASIKVYDLDGNEVLPPRRRSVEEVIEEYKQSPEYADRREKEKMYIPLLTDSENKAMMASRGWHSINYPCDDPSQAVAFCETVDLNEVLREWMETPIVFTSTSKQRYEQALRTIAEKAEFFFVDANYPDPAELIGQLEEIAKKSLAGENPVIPDHTHLLHHFVGVCSECGKSIELDPPTTEAMTKLATTAYSMDLSYKPEREGNGC